MSDSTLTIIGIIAGIVVGVPTLYFTFQSKKISLQSKQIAEESKEIAVKAYQHQKEVHNEQINLIEPWVLTKVGDTRWLLERTFPKPATIYGFMGDGLCYNDFNVTLRGQGGAGFPARSLQKGDKIVLNITPLNPEFGINSNFHLYYEEHDSPTNNNNYQGYMDVPPADMPSSVRPWSTPLY